MRVLFTLQPGEGHLAPLLPVARELVRLGHEVAFCAARRFCPALEQRGFTAFPAGLDWLEAETEATFPEVRRLSPQALGAWYMSELFADLALHRMVPDLRALCGAWRPDVLVHGDYELASCIVSELTRIPHATIGGTFLWPPAMLENALAEPLAFARSAFGLAPYPALAMLHPYLYLSYVPARWQTVAIPVLHSVHPGLAAGPRGELPAWAHTLAPQPTVYASMGTVNNRRPEVFPAILEALRGEPINLILTVGRNQDPARFGPQPAHVHIERFIPQDDLFPLCDLFVTSSSFFTILRAVLHEVPVLMAPITGDEPAQAARFARLGAGCALRPREQQQPWLGAEVPELGVESLRAAVRAMLASTEHLARVRALRDDVLAQPPPSHAVALLERLAAERAPILAPSGARA